MSDKKSFTLNVDVFYHSFHFSFCILQKYNCSTKNFFFFLLILTLYIKINKDKEKTFYYFYFCIEAMSLLQKDSSDSNANNILCR